MGLFPKQALYYAALNDIPRGPNSHWYVVDSQTGHGSDTNPGTFEAPLATLAAAEDLCVANHNDAVLLVGGPTSYAVTAVLAWDKAYTHLIGLSGNLSTGQRTRVTGSATADLLNLVTFSGKGCIVRNIQFYNGADLAQDSGAVIVSAEDMEFTNCYFTGINNEAVVGIRAGAYSLALAGAVECLFKNCHIGGTSTLRAAANAELKMTAGASQNTFKDCIFTSKSATAGKFMVSLETTAASMGWNRWVDCLFHNDCTGWVTPLTDCFNIPAAGMTHYEIIHNCQLVGITGWSNDVTHLYNDGPAPVNTAGTSLNPTA